MRLLLLGDEMKAAAVATMAIASLVVASTAHAQTNEEKESAFGFHKGMTAKQAKAAAPLTQEAGRPNAYFTKSPPLPLAPFDQYDVIIGPRSGVCIVLALTGTMKPNGPQLEVAFTNVLNKLVALHGDKYKQAAGDKTTVWTNALGPGTSVELLVQIRQTEAFIALNYYFSNATECLAEIRGGP